MSDIKATEPTQDVTTFDAAFANCPEKDDWRAFGEDARATFDSTDTAVQGISLSAQLLNLMHKTKARLGDSYTRKDFVALVNLAMATYNVPSGINANQLIPLVWIVKLDKSVPGEPGKPRTWAGEVSDPGWYGGNLTMGSLRVLASLIRRVSGKSEADEWDFQEGWEPYARAYIKSLRACSLSLKGLETLIKQRKAELEAEAARAAKGAMTDAELKAVQEADAMQEREAKLTKLGSEILETYRSAVADLKMDKEQFSKLLRDKGVVDPKAIAPSKLTPAQIGDSLTAGDAKALAQHIIAGLERDPAKWMPIFHAMSKEFSAAVKKMKSAKEAA